MWSQDMTQMAFAMLVMVGVVWLALVGLVTMAAHVFSHPPQPIDVPREHEMRSSRGPSARSAA